MIRIAVMGAGRIGALHAELLGERSVEGCSISGIIDADQARADEIAGRWNVTSDPDRALRDSDAVVVATPSESHADAVLKLLHLRVPTLVEKPLATTLDDCDRIVRTQYATGTPLQVGFNRRFDHSHARLIAQVRSGVVGQLAHVIINGRDRTRPSLSFLANSGGIFVDLAIHDYDMALAVTQSPVESVMALGDSILDPEMTAIEVDDVATTLLRHANGVVSTIVNSRHSAAGDVHRIEAYGSKGGVSSVDPEPLAHDALTRYRTAFVEQLRVFGRFVSEGGPSPVSARSAREALRIALVAESSRRLGGEWIGLDEPGF